MDWLFRFMGWHRWMALVYPSDPFLRPKDICHLCGVVREQVYGVNEWQVYPVHFDTRRRVDSCREEQIRKVLEE